MENLGQRIRELRTEKELTQPQLAVLVGVSNGIISAWENNVNEPKATYIKKLAAVLGVTTDFLLGNND